MSSMPNKDFQASLARLESMAKGQGATQLHHTASDSVPADHAGTGTSDYQDEHNDGISDNGTDYDGVKKALAAKVEKSQALTPAEVAIVKGDFAAARKKISDKVVKGESLTGAESWVIKGADKPGKAGTPGEAKDATSVPDSHAGESEQDEIEADAKKSLGSAINQSQSLRNGIEMSPILAEFASAIGHALNGSETRVAKSVASALAPIVERVTQVEATINKSLAEQSEYNVASASALYGIGQFLQGSGQVAAQQAGMPAGGPVSQMRTQTPQPNNVVPIQKSFGPGGLPTGSEAMAKSQVLEVMSDLAVKGEISTLDVVKYDTGGGMSQHVQQKVLRAAQGQ